VKGFKKVCSAGEIRFYCCCSCCLLWWWCLRFW